MQHKVSNSGAGGEGQSLNTDPSTAHYSFPAREASPGFRKRVRRAIWNREKSIDSKS